MQLTLASWPHLLVLLLPLLLPLIFLLYRRQDAKKKQQPADAAAAGALEWPVDVLKQAPTHTATFKAFGLPGIVITANPENLEHIAKTSFANYPKGDRMSSTLRDFLGHGIFNSDGDQWLWQRKAASYEFSQRSLRKFIVDTVQSEVVERLLPLLEQAAAGSHGHTLDMQHVLECFAFDNICHVAFGDDPACLARDGAAAPPATVEFMRAFDYVENTILVRFDPREMLLWRLKKMLNLQPEKQIRESLAVVHGYADKIVRRCRERQEEEEAGPEPESRGDFLAHFAAARGDLSDETLRDVVTNVLVAGRDTTSSALTWFLWLVSARPDVEDKIVREIRTVRRSRSSSGGGSTSTAAATFSLDELREMHYIHAAVTESMRLYPPVPQGMHHCKQDDLLPDGTFVGKGWTVSHSTYAMARMADIWGKDCDEFRPERWLRDDGTFQPESPFKYPVFHGGPRMCLGKEMAYIQMKSVVSSAFERFSFRFLGGEERPGMDQSFTLRMRGGLPMQVIRRPE